MLYYLDDVFIQKLVNPNAMHIQRENCLLTLKLTLVNQSWSPTVVWNPYLYIRLKTLSCSNAMYLLSVKISSLFFLTFCDPFYLVQVVLPFFTFSHPSQVVKNNSCIEPLEPAIVNVTMILL